MITDRQRYLFDLRGYIVVDDVLSERAVADLHRIIDRHYTPPKKLTQDNCARFDFLKWDPKLLELAGHAPIIEWVRELCGEHIRLDHAYFYHMRHGEPEHLGMHGNGDAVDHCQYFYFKNGRMHNGLVVVSIALNDSKPGDGGFCCVPGSHKSNYPNPFDPDEQSDPVVQVPVKAGSLVVFTEALRHGSMLWQSNTERRSLFYKYAPAPVAYGFNYAAPWQELLATIPADWSQEKRQFFRELLAEPHESHRRVQRLRGGRAAEI